MAKLNIVERIIISKNGTVTINLDADAANADWIRASRLQEKAKNGDKKAEKALAILENTPMVEFSEEELAPDEGEEE